MTRVLAFIALAAAATASADCAGGSLEAWPPESAALPLNPQLTVTGHGVFAPSIEGMAVRSPRLDGADGHRVPLSVVSIDRGAWHATQAVLRSAAALRPGVRYVLAMDAVEGETGGWTSPEIAWTAGSEADRSAPRWTSPPLPLRGSAELFGCGPALFASARTEIADAGGLRQDAGPDGPREHPASGRRHDDGPVQVLVTLWPEGDPANRQRMRVPVKDGAISIGHDMCQGAFAVEAGAHYVATLTALDAAGHETPAPGGPIRLRVPAHAESP